MEALEQRGAGSTPSNPANQHRDASRANMKYAALEKPDRDIAARLDKLREKPKGLIFVHQNGLNLFSKT